jgi:hypothetical protein
MIPFKQWAYEEAVRGGVTVSAIRERVWNHCYDIEINKLNARVWTVIRAKLKPKWAGKPFKEWRYEEAQRQQTTPWAIYQRVQRGKYPDLHIVRASARTWFVK